MFLRSTPMRSLTVLAMALALLGAVASTQAYAEETLNGEELSAGWLQQQELKPPQPCSYACHFGGWVSIQGDTAVVTEPDEETSGGYAYVYERLSSGEWVEQARLAPPTSGRSADEPESFGQNVGISGSTIVVSAWEHNEDKGAAYVYERSASGTWSLQAELSGKGAAHEAFGWNVAIEGSTIVAGAPQRGGSAGAVYVFTRTASGTWSRSLIASGTQADESLGWAVGISGSTIIAGAPWFEEPVENGAAYVFARSASGTWTQVAKLAGSSEAVQGYEGDHFGSAISISGDRALIGAFHGGSEHPGLAYVYSDESGSWTRQAKLKSANAAAGEQFGYAVGLLGSSAIVGAYSHHSGTGAAYVFRSSEAGAWFQRAKLTASHGADGDVFGLSVAIDGSTALVGADEVEGLGVAYVFEHASG
jgi:hypothetical protein